MSGLASLEVKLSHPTVTRHQILFTSLLSLGVSLAFFTVENPFHVGYPLTALISGIFHLLLFLYFDRIFPAHPLIFSFFSFFNLVLLGFSVHYTGGILSPFNFFFIFIVVSDAANGISNPFGLVVALIVYLTVIGGELLGFLPSVPISTQNIYNSILASSLIILVTVFFTLVTAGSYKTIMNSLRDELEKKQRHKEKIQKELLMLQAPSQIGLLVNRIVHDIRGPLGAISGFVKTIQGENKLTAESEEDCALMLSELSRINNLMNRMTAYTRLGEAAKDVICPVNLLETVLAVVSFYPGAKLIKYETTFASPDRLKIYANKEEMQQVLFNILKNSIEALECRDQPRINLGVYGSGPDVLLVIRDNGPGVLRHLAGRVTNEIVSTKKSGAGVGLVIAKEIIEGHGGQLEFKSQEGEGTTVTIRLPRHSASLQSIKNKEGMKLNDN